MIEAAEGIWGHIEVPLVIRPCRHRFVRDPHGTVTSDDLHEAPDRTVVALGGGSRNPVGIFETGSHRPEMLLVTSREPSLMSRTDGPDSMK